MILEAAARVSEGAHRELRPAACFALALAKGAHARARVCVCVWGHKSACVFMCVCVSVRAQAPSISNLVCAIEGRLQDMMTGGGQATGIEELMRDVQELRAKLKQHVLVQNTFKYDNVSDTYTHIHTNTHTHTRARARAHAHACERASKRYERDTHEGIARSRLVKEFMRLRRRWVCVW